MRAVLLAKGVEYNLLALFDVLYLLGILHVTIKTISNQPMYG